MPTTEEMVIPKRWTIVDQIALDQKHYEKEWTKREKRRAEKNLNYQPKPFPGYKSSGGNGMADGA